MATLKISSDLQNVIKKVVLDTYFPVGSLYLTVGSENPNKTIGGTWTKLSGYYLYADTSINNTSYTGKHTQSHTLTANQSGLPAHNHNIHSPFYKFSELNLGFHGDVYKGDMHQDSWTNTEFSGGSNASEGHSHNIATKGIYVWQRTK